MVKGLYFFGDLKHWICLFARFQIVNFKMMKVMRCYFKMPATRHLIQTLPRHRQAQHECLQPCSADKSERVWINPECTTATAVPHRDHRKNWTCSWTNHYVRVGLWLCRSARLFSGGLMVEQRDSRGSTLQLSSINSYHCVDLRRRRLWLCSIRDGVAK